jgi:hypothetical protein
MVAKGYLSLLRYLLALAPHFVGGCEGDFSKILSSLPNARFEATLFSLPGPEETWAVTAGKSRRILSLDFFLTACRHSGYRD